MPCPVTVTNGKFENWTAGELDNWTLVAPSGGSAVWSEVAGEVGSAVQIAVSGGGSHTGDAEYYIDGPSNARRKFVVKVRCKGDFSFQNDTKSVLMWREDSLGVPADQQQDNAAFNNIYGTLALTVSPSRVIKNRITIRLQNSKSSGGGFGPRNDIWDELYIDFLGPPAVRASSLLRTPSANLRGADQALLRAPC